MENTTWPGWRQVRKLGSGSFGTVFEICREDDPTYRAALKVISIPYDETELNNIYSEGMNDDNVSTYFKSMVEDVTREITLMDQFKGLTNIVSYEEHKVIKHQNDIGWDILIRMELLTPLQTYERERGYGLNEDETIKLGQDICQALIACEKFNIVHRDIKPENIFVNRFGDFVLGDFGIARQMEKSMGSMSVKGTYNYMAPEVYNGQHYGKTADIYSLGMVLYRCLNNNRGPFLPPISQPITYGDRQDAIRRRMSGETLPYPANGSDYLKNIVLKATKYDSSQRFVDAEELQLALKSVHELNDWQVESNNMSKSIDQSSSINHTQTVADSSRKKHDNKTIVHDATRIDEFQKDSAGQTEFTETKKNRSKESYIDKYSKPKYELPLINILLSVGGAIYLTYDVLLNLVVGGLYGWQLIISALYVIGVFFIYLLFVIKAMRKRFYVNFTIIPTFMCVYKYY